MLKKTLQREIKHITGTENFSTDQADLVCYSYDASGISAIPDAVALISDVEQIPPILKIASESNIPVVPRGAGTSTTGSAVPIKGGIVLAMSRLNQIKKIVPEDLMLETEPGAITGTIQKKAAKFGLFYPPDPASLNFCTIGGNVATCAGGPRCVKYGVTRDFVLGLDIALPNGEIVSTGVRTAKGVVGYDLTRLFVGSEGTLGIITNIKLKLIPQPAEIGTIIAFFKDPRSACDAITCILTSGIRPRCAEFLDAFSLYCIQDTLPPTVRKNAKAMLIIEVDGSEPQSIQFESQMIKSCCESQDSILCNIAKTDREAGAMWKARRALSPSLKKLGPPHKISEDICIPRKHLADMVENVHKLGEKYQLIALVFGHAGDGNLHVNMLLDKNNPKQLSRVHLLIEELMDITLKLGGTISGEHGIGITKKDFIGKELNNTSISLMKHIKDIFDPTGIMNPGKVFPDTN